MEMDLVKFEIAEHVCQLRGAERKSRRRRKLRRDQVVGYSATFYDAWLVWKSAWECSHAPGQGGFQLR